MDRKISSTIHRCLYFNANTVQLRRQNAGTDSQFPKAGNWCLLGMAGWPTEGDEQQAPANSAARPMVAEPRRALGSRTGHCRRRGRGVILEGVPVLP